MRRGQFFAFSIAPLESIPAYSREAGYFLAGAEGFEPPLAVLETAGLPLNLRPCVGPHFFRAYNQSTLLNFAVHLVLPAMRAELLHLQALRRGLLVLRGRIIPILAFRALKSNDVARHCFRLLVVPGRECPALFYDLGHGARAHGAAALANREAQPLVHGHRRDQFHLQVHAVARHHHLRAFRQLRHSRHVRRPEVELRPVAAEERRAPIVTLSTIALRSIPIASA